MCVCVSQPTELGHYTEMGEYLDVEQSRIWRVCIPRGYVRLVSVLDSSQKPLILLTDYLGGGREGGLERGRNGET